jgi:hypothetical protein
MLPMIGSGRGPGGLGYRLRQVKRRRASTARDARTTGNAIEESEVISAKTVAERGGLEAPFPLIQPCSMQGRPGQ